MKEMKRQARLSERERKDKVRICDITKSLHHHCIHLESHKQKQEQSHTHAHNQSSIFTLSLHVDNWAHTANLLPPPPHTYKHPVKNPASAAAPSPKQSHLPSHSQKNISFSRYTEKTRINRKYLQGNNTATPESCYCQRLS